ncbi:hypothetical protein F8566_26885 [Actinomadura rudentiformis]|uniref:Peptidase n=2 Tax=Actinomadura rudentiformis TaxID=359158 RepID=A0A6H9YVV1_9ACTN|nr:hypothetical protein F8566_26885 [Actinomadura rudentiformis]
MLAALALIAGLLPSAAMARSSSAPPPVDPGAAAASGITNTTSSKKILDYWTTARIRAATPEPLPRPAPQPTAEKQVKNVLPPQAAGGARPARLKGTSDSPRVLAHTQAQRWNRQGSMPATTIGKIYYVRNNGTPGYCSGSVINGNNKNTVWTSGHCIHAGGGGAGNYFRDFIFVPDADNNREPHGRWTYRYANTTIGWERDGNWSYDVAAIAFNPQAQRGNLADWVGYQGYRFGYGQAFNNIHAFGFPQDGYRRTDFSGNDLWYCLTFTWRAGVFDDRIHMECDMHHGASGGPWLEDLQLSRGWGYIIGAYSHRNVDGNQMAVDTVAKSPNHGDAAINVRNDVHVR